MKPAIVIVAYNRLDQLQRLLKSVERSYGLMGVTLVISLDHSELQDEMRAFVESYHWPYGDLELIVHSKNIGLRKHILFCGDLSNDYGSIVLLEDDLYVSRHFYNYARQALNHYKNCSEISGISLYNHSFNETAQMRFDKLDDSSDVYFLQLASSWGQAWTSQQWNSFRAWYGENSQWEAGLDHVLIPDDVLKWPKSSWKKFFIKYNIENNLFFVYPKLSLTTNFSDVGTHHRAKNPRFQVSLATNRDSNWSFSDIRDSNLVYDAFCEIMPDCLSALSRNKIFDDEVEIDIYGTKPLDKIKKKYLLSARKCSNPMFSFGLELKPKEINVISQLEGSVLSFATTESFQVEKNISQQNEKEYYFGLP